MMVEGCSISMVWLRYDLVQFVGSVLFFIVFYHSQMACVLSHIYTRIWIQYYSQNKFNNIYKLSSFIVYIYIYKLINNPAYYNNTKYNTKVYIIQTLCCMS